MMWLSGSTDDRVSRKREEQRRNDPELQKPRPVKTLRVYLSRLDELISQFAVSEDARQNFTGLHRPTANVLKKYFGLFVFITLLFAFVRYLSSPGSGTAAVLHSARIRRGYLGKDTGRQHHWPGWSGIRKIYAFGDSHTDTSFHLDGKQPDEYNPLGNPAFPGQTRNFGSNYLGFLTGTFNESQIRTYNLATSGSIVTDREAFQSPVVDKFPRLSHWTLSNQVDYAFRSRYGKGQKKSKARRGHGWAAAETLFVLYPGNNELLEEYLKRHGGRNLTEVELYLNEIEKNLKHLYDYGARNFLIINNACIEETPAIHVAGIIDGEGRLGAEMVDINGRLAFTAHSFAETHPDATVFLFDNYSLTIRVRGHPADYPETAKMKKMEGFCFPYAEKREDLNVDDPLCGEPLEHWFWRDDEHITEPYHKLMARLIVKELSDIENALPYEFF